MINDAFFKEVIIYFSSISRCICISKKIIHQIYINLSINIPEIEYLFIIVRNNTQQHVNKKFLRICLTRKRLKRKKRIIFSEEIEKDSSVQDEMGCWEKEHDIYNV